MEYSNAAVCFERIVLLAEGCKKLIIVSIGGLTTGKFDAETDNYIHQLNQLNEKLADISSNCIKF